MTTKTLAYGLLLSTALVLPAAAQNTNQSPTPGNAPAAQKAEMQKHAGQWRSSKMIGLDVYNQQNEKLGDINEILIDKSGKIVGYVIGVGGFLGMGEHDILVSPDKLTFATEPARTASTAADRQTTGTAANKDNARRDAGEKWWPDHAMLNANKDQLKAMPQFKYSNYN